MSNSLWPHGPQHRVQASWVHHQHLELTETHVHRVGDAIKPSQPLSSPSPSFNLAQHQGLFQGVSSSYQVAKLLEFQLQYQSFQWIFRTDFLDSWLVWSPCSPRDSQKSSPTPQFKSISSSALNLLYGPTFTSVLCYSKLLNSDKILLRRIFWNFFYVQSHIFK